MNTKSHPLFVFLPLFCLVFLTAGCADSVVEDSSGADASTAEDSPSDESQTTEEGAGAVEEEPAGVTAMVDKLVVAADGTITHEEVDFQEALKAGEGVVLVDFWAAWCGPCRKLAPELEKLATAYAGTVTIIKVDVDKAGDLAAEYGVSSIPDVRVFKSGKQVDQLVGYLPAEKITAKLGL